jgi:hypothetical protein
LSNYKGYLISLFNKNGTLIGFPEKYIQKDTYKSTPDQRTEIKAYRDDSNLLHRVTSPNYKTKIEFQTYPLTLGKLEEIQGYFSRAMINPQQRKLKVRCWDEELLDYRDITAYLTDTTYPVKTISTENIKYDVIKYTLIEY